MKARVDYFIKGLLIPLASLGATVVQASLIYYDTAHEEFSS